MRAGDASPASERAEPAPAAPPASAPAPSDASAAPEAPATPAAAPPGAKSGAKAAAAEAPGATKRRCSVAFIGDSLTDLKVGGGGYVRYLEARAPGSRFVSFAKGGAMVNQMRRQLPAGLLAEPPGAFTHVVVFGGVNDLYSDETAGRTPTKIEADLGAIYRAAKAHGARVVAITVAPWGGFTRYYNERRARATRELNAWILGAVGRGEVDAAVDAYTLLACGDPEVICPRYRRARDDGLHFGKGGHEALGAALHEAEFASCR